MSSKFPRPGNLFAPQNVRIYFCLDVFFQAVTIVMAIDLIISVQKCQGDSANLFLTAAANALTRITLVNMTKTANQRLE